MVEWTPPGPGPWQQDAAHNPISQTRCMQELYPPGYDRGFTETFSRYGILLDRLAMSMVNGYSYIQPQPFDMPGPDGPPSEEQIGAEIGRRTEVAARAFADKIWRADIELWDTECKPNSISRHRELGDVDLAALDESALADHLRAAAAHVGEMAYQHHRFNVSALVPVSDFALHASEWTGRPPPSMFGVFDGYSPVSSVVPTEMEAGVEAIRADAEAAGLVKGSGDAGERLAAVRERLPAVDDYVRNVDFRVTEGFDISNPTLRERPELILGKLASALDTDPDATRRRADALAAEIRDEVPEEHRDTYDELLAEGRLVYRLRDERGIYSDISAVGLVRLAMLEVGRRAQEAGRVHDAEHLLEATVDEAVQILEGRGPSADELADWARKRAELTAAGAPPLLGPPPPEPPPVDELPPPLARVMRATGFAIHGVLGQLEEPAGDETVVVGIPGGAGVYEGPARLINGTEDLYALQAGEVLVAPTTGEAFNSMLHLVAAIVTDHGGFASHAAIVAREMGFPAVVGTVNGTSRINTGDTVRVDGATGEVTIVG